jgi:predicted ABC-type ATPase
VSLLKEQIQKSCNQKKRIINKDSVKNERKSKYKKLHSIEAQKTLIVLCRLATGTHLKYEIHSVPSKQICGTVIEGGINGCERSEGMLREHTKRKIMRCYRFLKSIWIFTNGYNP